MTPIPPENVLHIATVFTDSPGSRYRHEGEGSGQEFLQDYLLDRFGETVESGGQLIVDLDGAAGYATSFLEEAFGGLARAFTAKVVNKHLVLRCNDEPYLLDEIRIYIEATL